MNLLDIIPVASKSKAKLAPKVLAEFEQTRDNIKITCSTLNTELGRSVAENSIAQLVQKLNQHSEKVATTFFMEHLALPDNLQFDEYFVDRYGGPLITSRSSRSTLMQFSQSPRINLVDLVDISAKAGMIIIPFEYLNSASYKNEDYTTTSVIRKFDRAAKEKGLITWVVCPVRHYSILDHLKAKDANQAIIGNAYQANFDILNMMMPALLMLSDRLTVVEGGLTSLYTKVNELDASMRGVVRGLESMEKQLKALQDKVEQQHQEALKVKIPNTQFAEFEKSFSKTSYADSWFMPYDPLMFATLPDPNFNGDDQALIGPCWGPDFPDIVAATLEWKQKKNQRITLEKTVNNLWY